MTSKRRGLFLSASTSFNCSTAAPIPVSEYTPFFTDLSSHDVKDWSLTTKWDKVNTSEKWPEVKTGKKKNMQGSQSQKESPGHSLLVLELFLESAKRPLKAFSSRTERIRDTKKTTKRYIVSSRHSFTSQDYKNKLQVALSYCVQCLPLLLGLSLQVLSMSAKCPLKCNRNLLLRIEPSCMKSGLDIFMSILFMRGIREIRQSDP